MTRILVTGATSFLGRTLVPRLVGGGHEVHVLVRATSDLGDLARLSVAVHRLATDGSNVRESVDAADADVTIHLAGTYLRSHRPEDVGRLVDDNVRFGAEVVDAVASAGRRLIPALSYFQHGLGTGYEPLNLYAATKQAFEDIVDFYARSAALDTVKLVLFDVYGELDPRVKLVNAAVNAARAGTPLDLASSSAIIDLVHVDDVCAAFERAIALDPSVSIDSRRYAVRSGDTKTVGEVLDVVEDVAGAPIDRRWGAFPPAPGVTRVWEGPLLPGWEPKIDLRAGVERMLARSPG